jgi:hypothetical protein
MKRPKFGLLRLHRARVVDDEQDVDVTIRDRWDVFDLDVAGHGNELRHRSISTTSDEKKRQGRSEPHARVCRARE